jgi:transcriptional regulator with XRE-family HTH domain
LLRTTSNGKCAILEKSIYSKQGQKLREALRKAREDAKLTQQQLADKLGKPQSFVAKYEGGERRLDMVELVEIAKHIQLNLSQFLKKL